MLRFKKISFKEKISVENDGLMIFCYALEDFMSLGDFDFTKLV